MSDLCQDRIHKNTGAAVHEKQTTADTKDSSKYKAVSIQQNSM